jgi:adenosylcobinamide-phosphate synthase
MGECILVFSAAFILDSVLGDPEYTIHPVRLMGKAIQRIEAGLRSAGLSGLAGGLLLVVSMMCFSLGTYLGLRSALRLLHPWLVIFLHLYLVYSCIALRDLLDRSGLVAKALEKKELAKARQKVQEIVGRDAGRLDVFGVARAAVESLAENFVDGFLSPVFWYFVGGVSARLSGVPPCIGAALGILGFKVVNTFDSMVGYRNERYMQFGRTATRLDDMMNFLPARLAIPIIAAAAGICRFDAANCLKIGWRDRLKHPSPNAGHAESCVAGALDIRLGGPTIYSHGVTEKPWLGDSTPAVSHEHISECRTLILWSGLVTLCILLLALGSLYLIDSPRPFLDASLFGKP